MNEFGGVEPELDSARVAAVAHLVGREKLSEMLDLLSQRLTSLVEPALPAATAVRVVHQSQGSAGSLGLDGLHRALRTLEQRFVDGDEGAIQREIGALCQLFAAERALLEDTIDGDRTSRPTFAGAERLLSSDLSCRTLS